MYNHNVPMFYLLFPFDFFVRMSIFQLSFSHLDSVQSCVVHNVPMCSELFPPSFSPALQNALPDLIRFGKWLCGVVNSDGMCVKSAVLSQ